MSTAFKSADILLPKNADMSKWAVVACDQYTSEPEYWADVEKITEGAKSALNLILPEVYLEDDNVDERIADIHKNMDSYISEGVFEEYKDAMIYVERTQSDGKVRAGIVGAIDLEEYDYRKGSKSAVRATEATVVERIPPRIKVRRGAHIAGYLVDKPMQEKIIAALEKLGDIDAFNTKYGLKETSPLVYAMGDGNHSLATAKEFYEEQKRENPDKDMSNALCRYALVEIVNLHSPALEFEAIHRIVTDVDTKALMSEMTAALELSEEKSEQAIVVCDNGEEKTLYIHKPTSKLTVGSLQNFLDSYIKEKGGKVDYIHGAEVIRELSAKENSIGFMLPDMGKEELFPTVIVDGALPRKTFSMGHAEDKRFYVEARKILK